MPDLYIFLNCKRPAYLGHNKGSKFVYVHVKKKEYWPIYQASEIQYLCDIFAYYLSSWVCFYQERACGFVAVQQVTPKSHMPEAQSKVFKMTPRTRKENLCVDIVGREEEIIMICFENGRQKI